MEFESFTNYFTKTLLTGHGIPLFNQQGREDKDGYIKKQHGRNIAKWIFGERPFNISLIDLTFLKALFLKKNKKLYKEFSRALQEVLDNCFLHLINQHVNKDQYNYLFTSNKESQLKIIMNTALSYLAYCEPTNKFFYNIPQKIHGHWIQVKYKVERIQLTHDYLGAPYYAYGLVPQNNQQANPILLFMGTNPIPTANGFHHSIMSDFMPMHSVGEHLYLLGKDKIDKWVNKYYKPNKPVISIGQSLGGSLSVISHIYNPDKIKSIAINPPLWLNNLKQTYHKIKQNVIKLGKTIIENPITIFTQENDPVFKIGTWIPKCAELFIISSKHGKNNGTLASHRNCFAAHRARNRVKFFNINFDDEINKLSRIFTTITWQLLSVSICLININILILKALYYYSVDFVTTNNNLINDNSNKESSHNPIIFSKSNNKFTISNSKISKKSQHHVTTDNITNNSPKHNIF